MSTSSRNSPSVFVAGYAICAYVVFLAVLTYAIGFFAGVGVPKGIDDGAVGAVPSAVAVDLALLTAFAVQHTVMARQSFKRLWLRVVPATAERATYVLVASLLLALMFWLWRPLDSTVWRVEGAGAVVLRAMYVGGWVLAVTSTFLVSHTDLFGLRQAWRQHRYRPPQFTERGLYKLVRHPLMTGFIVVFWSAPTLSVGHLLFAAASTGYIVVGIAFEERDLVREAGVVYTDYRRRVPALVPWPDAGRKSRRRQAHRTTIPTAFERRHPL